MPFQNKNTQQDATRREFNNQKGIQRPDWNSTTRRELNDKTESTYGKPTAKQRTQRSDRCSPRDKRRGGQMDASPRDKRRGREELLFKAVLYVLARAIKQEKKKNLNGIHIGKEIVKL